MLIDDSRDRPTLRPVARYADACNRFGDPATVARTPGGSSQSAAPPRGGPDVNIGDPPVDRAGRPPPSRGSRHRRPPACLPDRSCPFIILLRQTLVVQEPARTPAPRRPEGWGANRAGRQEAHPRLTSAGSDARRPPGAADPGRSAPIRERAARCSSVRPDEQPWPWRQGGGEHRVKRSHETPPFRHRAFGSSGDALATAPVEQIQLHTPGGAAAKGARSEGVTGADSASRMRQCLAPRSGIGILEAPSFPPTERRGARLCGPIQVGTLLIPRPGSSPFDRRRWPSRMENSEHRRRGRVQLPPEKG